jgi:DNA-binding transcriptional MerR regulator
MLPQKPRPLFIGQIAVQSGLPIKTIRYYDDLGLLKSLGRTKGGFRQFSPEVFNRLAFIKRAQNLGLCLQEIGEFLQEYDKTGFPCPEIKQKLKEQIQAIDRQIEQLLSLKTDLANLLSGRNFFINNRADIWLRNDC